VAVAALGPAQKGGHTAVDIGCGGQSNVVFPTATHVIGVDVDEAGLARDATVTESLLMSINDLDLEEASADAVACIFMLEHVEEPDVVFGKLVRAAARWGDGNRRSSGWFPESADHPCHTAVVR